MVTEVKKSHQKIVSFIRARKLRLALWRWYLLARQSFLVVLAAVVTFALLGLFAGFASAQGTLVVPLGITPKESGPAHQTQQFPYKENYFMLPVTSSGTIQSGYGQRTVVNKPVTINSKRKTVIPLSGLTTQASPTPVVPEGFNARYVPHTSPQLNPPPQPTYQAQKPVYSRPVVTQRYIAPTTVSARAHTPAVTPTPAPARPEPETPRPAPAANPASPPSILVPKSPEEPYENSDIFADPLPEAAPEEPADEPAESVYDQIPAEMDAALPALPTQMGGESEPETPIRRETGYHDNIHGDDAPGEIPVDSPMELPAEPDFTRLPERATVPVPPQLPTPVHTRFYGADVTEVTEPDRTDITPAVTPTYPPSGQTPAALPTGPRPRRPGNAMDLYREQTSTTPQAPGAYAAPRSGGENPGKAALPADSRSGIPVNMSREKKGGADAYPTTLPPGQATENPRKYQSWSGPSV